MTDDVLSSETEVKHDFTKGNLILVWIGGVLTGGFIWEVLVCA